jgi:hypothetical protein
VVHRFDAVTQKILKANNERKAKPAVARFVYDFKDIDGTALFLERTELTVK